MYRVELYLHNELYRVEQPIASNAWLAPWPWKGAHWVRGIANKGHDRQPHCENA